MAGPTATTPDLWLKADVAYHTGTTQATDGQTIATWPDQSGNGNNCTAVTAATWKANQQNSLPGVLFDRTAQQYYTHPYLGELGTVFVVLSPIDVNGDRTLLGAKTSAAIALGAYYFKAASGGQARPCDYIRATSSDTDGSGPLNLHAPSNSDGGFWTYLAGRLSGSTTIRTYKQGSLVATGTSANALRALNSAASLGAGYYSGSPVDYYDGYVGEVLAYSSNLSDAEFALVHAYLMSRWGFATPAGNFLFSCFQPNEVPVTKLYLLQSSDALTWTYRPCGYIPTGSSFIRDPSITLISGTYWIAHTNVGDASTACTTFDVATSTDGIIFTPVAQVDCSSITGNTVDSRAWAPEWFLDATAPEGVRVLVALSSTNDPGNFQIYETHPTNAGFTAWSALAVLTGSGLPTSMIDPFLVPPSTEPGGKYGLWYKNEVAGHKTIEYAESSSLLSGYTVTQSGDWAGWGTGLEGTSLMRTGVSSWRIYLDASGTGMYYSDDSGSAWASWSAKALITTPFPVQHGTVMLFTQPVAASPPRIVNINQAVMAAVY